MTEAEVAKLRRWVEFRYRSWRGNPDWDDMVQEGVIAVWKALEETEGSRWHPAVVTRRAADWALGDFLRSSRCLRPVARKGQAPLPQQVSLQEWDRDSYHCRKEPGDDFVEALLNRIDAAATWARWKAGLSPKMAATLWEYLGCERLLTEIANEQGRSLTAAFQTVVAGIERCRAGEGLGPRARKSPKVAEANGRREPGASKVCERCGARYQRPRSVSRYYWERRRYCSKECAYAATHPEWSEKRQMTARAA